MCWTSTRPGWLLGSRVWRRGYDGVLAAAFPALARPQQLFVAEDTLRAARASKGRAAIAYGDLDKADNIAFCVPGLMTSVDNVNNVASDAQALYSQATKADPGRQTAVVAWHGYDAPNFGNVVFQDAAEAGAKLLAADVNAMRTTHDGPIAMLTVVAHSYGSTTTGLALQREHLGVDQVALIGSPGVGGEAKTVADLHLLPSQVFVGSASTDIVTDSPGLLGANPATGHDHANDVGRPRP